MAAGAPHKPPVLVKVPVGLKLPRWLLDWMRQQDQSMAVLIEDALCKRHKLKPPNEAFAQEDYETMKTVQTRLGDLAERMKG